jgi:hypothetical protein
MVLVETVKSVRYRDTWESLPHVIIEGKARNLPVGLTFIRGSLEFGFSGARNN